MSGHNKWTQIKRKKGAEDAKKSKLFSLHSKVISMESKKAKGDKSAPGLRAAIERARALNVPNDTIDRAVAKGMGAGAENFEEVVYEAFGPGGVAIIIEGITDNKNRTTPEIKHLLSDHGVTLGGQGSTLWAFTKQNNAAEDGKKWIANSLIPLADSDKEKVANLIETIEEHDDIKNIYTNANFEE